MFLGAFVIALSIFLSNLFAFLEFIFFSKILIEFFMELRVFKFNFSVLILKYLSLARVNSLNSCPTTKVGEREIIFSIFGFV